MERRAELGLGELGAVDVVAVGFVDNDAVGHFHDAALDALKFVAGAGKLNEQEKVNHRVNGGFALAYADGFDENIIVARGLAEHYGFARFAGDATEAASRGRGADKGSGVGRQFLQSGLVAENGAVGAFARGVNGQHGEFAAAAENVEPEGAQDIFEPTRVTAEVGGKEVILECGRLANQADGAVWVQCGGTVVLVTVCSQPLEFDKGFFPLTVE